jgi:hypothetical protein
MIGRLVSNELYRIWKEPGMACSKYYPSRCLEVVKKIAEMLGQDSKCPGGDSNQALLQVQSFAATPVLYIAIAVH